MRDIMFNLISTGFVMITVSLCVIKMFDSSKLSYSFMRTVLGILGVGLIAFFVGVFGVIWCSS